MKAGTAKNIQKIIWHARWMLLVGIMAYNIYSFIVSFELSTFLTVHGFVFALYSFLRMWENYFSCKSSCKY